MTPRKNHIPTSTSLVVARSVDIVAYTPVDSIPAVIQNSGSPAIRAWRDFFDGTLPNPHTRDVYNRAVRQFFDWCSRENLTLQAISPADVGAYIRQHSGSLPSVKQHVSAIRRYFNLLVERHIVLMNPAAVARPPRYTVVEGKTPEITRDQIKELLGAIDRTSLIGLRDFAIFTTLIYTATRAGAACKLKLRDFRYSDRQMVLRFTEKRGKSREIPVRHDLEGYIHEYLEAAGLLEGTPATPIFQTTLRRTGTLTGRPMRVQDVCRMMKRRLKNAGLPSHLSPHSFRVATITNLLSQGIERADVQRLAGHADARVTALYDRSNRKVIRNVVERIAL